MSEGFLTNLDTVILFFRFCKRYNVNGQKERLALMREITRRKKATYLRDPEEFLRGKKVLRIKGREPK